MKNFTPEQFRSAFKKLSPEVREYILSGTCRPKIDAVWNKIGNTNKEQYGQVTLTLDAVLYGLLPLPACVSMLGEIGVTKEDADHLCGVVGTLLETARKSGAGTVVSSEPLPGSKEICEKFRSYTDVEALMSAIEKSVDGAVPPNEGVLADTLSDKKLFAVFRLACDDMHPRVRSLITSRRYQTASVDASVGLGIDAEGAKTLQLEVLLVLLGLQTVPDFETVIDNHPILAVGQGGVFIERVRENLFAEIALYVRGIIKSADENRSETLASCMGEDSEVQARLTKLPESVQAMVQSVQLEEAFATLQKKHHLDSPITRSLGEQVVRVMVGLTTMNDFKVNVTRVAGIPPSSLDALFVDTEQTLFKPVRTVILSALQKNIGSLPGKESSPTEDPYRTPVK